MLLGDRTEFLQEAICSRLLRHWQKTKTNSSYAGELQGPDHRKSGIEYVLWSAKTYSES